VLSLREFCENLNERERNERQEFVYEACVLMRDRITSREVWEAMGLDADECIEHADQSEIAKQFRYRLFSKMEPNVKSLGRSRTGSASASSSSASSSSGRTPVGRRQTSRKSAPRAA
jgi:hypothetical protein